MDLTQELIQRDLKHIWHPAASMKDFEKSSLLLVEKAKGAYLYTKQGPIIDAISSWWCKSLGHGHPAVIEAMIRQLQSFEHIIAANTTHVAMIELGEKLYEITRKPHVSFASDGSSAVEIALKLALHAQQIKGRPKRRQFVALKNAYHGETLGTLGVSDLGHYKAPYALEGLHCHFLEAGPLVSGLNDPLWHNADEHWQKALTLLEKNKDQVAAIIVEPLLQGAAGMLCYSGAFLKKLADWALANDIYFIADEIMTGMGRTGTWLASEQANIHPDLICLSKGLTSGAMPLSCVLMNEDIYQLFYEADKKHGAFLHSHTHSGNALAIAAALATIKAMEAEDVLTQAQQLGALMHKKFLNIAKQTQKLTQVRSLGAMVAANLKPLENRNLGPEIAEAALQRGALLRPIGNVLYWLPPLNTDAKTIDKLSQITLDSINTLYSL